MARTDAHRPSAINPEDYNFVSCDYYGGNPFEMMEMIEERKRFRAHMERTGGKYNQQQNGGTCHICGANASYVAKFHHVPSNTYITTGMDCATKMDMGDASLFTSFRKKVASGVRADKAAKAGKAKAEIFLNDNGLLAAWNTYLAQEANYRAHEGELGKEEQTVHDMVSKLIKYGTISEKQVAFIKNLVDRIANRATVEAEHAVKRAEQAAISKHVGTVGERIDFELTVCFATSFETQFGTMFVHVMNDAAGNVVVYKGSNEIGKRGEALKVKATIKKHDSREGVAQTLIARPKVAA
jgi:hypothetical protein